MIDLKLFLGAVALSDLFCELISAVKITCGEMGVRGFDRESNEVQSDFRNVQDFLY